MIFVVDRLQAGTFQAKNYLKNMRPRENNAARARVLCKKSETSSITPVGVTEFRGGDNTHGNMRVLVHGLFLYGGSTVVLTEIDSGTNNPHQFGHVLTCRGRFQ